MPLGSSEEPPQKNDPRLQFGPIVDKNGRNANFYEELPHIFGTNLCCISFLFCPRWSRFLVSLPSFLSFFPFTSWWCTVLYLVDNVGLPWHRPHDEETQDAVRGEVQRPRPSPHPSMPAMPVDETSAEYYPGPQQPEARRTQLRGLPHVGHGQGALRLAAHPGGCWNQRYISWWCCWRRCCGHFPPGGALQRRGLVL